MREAGRAGRAKRAGRAGSARAGADGRRGRARWLCGVLAAVLACGLGAGPGRAEVELPVPPGVLPPEVPEDNPLSAAKVALGQKLYFDTRLSTDGTVGCATCHNPRTGFADARGRTSAGVGGALGPRNSPTVLNAAFLLEQFWDGRAEGLEAQALQPLVNAIEHGFADHNAFVAKLRGLPEYRPLFREAFGKGAITAERAAQAIASFERTLISLSAPIDRFLAGDASALSAAARRGWTLFNGKARCNNCHGHVESLPTFSNEDYHNLGVGIDKLDLAKIERQAQAALARGESPEQVVAGLGLSDAEASELGRFAVTGELQHLGAFRTPPLRNIALTAPYMHDGSEATLADVMELYDRGGNANPRLDGGILVLELTAREKADLVALMRAFTSDDLQRFDHLKKLVAD